MPKIMKSLNRISRCQAIFRGKNLDGVCPAHHAFIFAICRAPGRPQDELARDICLNKSTVARAMTQMEEAGLVKRESNPLDKRQILVYPTEKALELLPKISDIAESWNSLISKDVSEEEMEIFKRVLSKIEKNASGVIGGEE